MPVKAPDTGKTQSQAFIDAAKKCGGIENEAAFKESLKQVAQYRPEAKPPRQTRLSKK